MWIMEDSLPKIKSYFKGIEMSDSVRSMLIRLMISILVRQGRNSAMHAASVLADEPLHRAQPARFLERTHWRAMDILGQLIMRLLESESWSGEYLLILDSTLVGHQGATMENTYSTGNRKRRPAKNRRYNKYKHARKSCHCFVFGLLITPEGVRIPFVKPLYTKAYAKQRKLKHRTQAQLAAQIIHELCVPSGVNVTVLGDTAFDAKVVRKACDRRGYAWIFPVNRRSVACASAPTCPNCVSASSTKMTTLSSASRTRRRRSKITSV